MWRQDLHAVQVSCAIALTVACSPIARICPTFVSVMIVDRIDPTSETALKAAGIEVQAGYTGTASAAARTYIGRTLSGTHEELEAS